MAGYLRFVPMLLCMGTLFFLSHLPGDSFDLPLFPGAVKLTHVFASGVLGATVIFGLSAEARRTKRVLVLVVAVLVPVLFGLSDEYHQSYIAGRSSEVLDLEADGAGGLIVGLCLFFKRGHN